MIRANFTTYRSYVTDSLYQWDKNQDLAISGLNLSVPPEIHFTNADMERALVRQSTLANGVVTVRIPNSLLQSALPIKAYVGVYEGDTFKVIETIEIPIIAKEKPADYAIEDSDEEIYSFKELENKISNLVFENSNDKVPVEQPINSNWEKWKDVRYHYGFDKTKQPIFNTVKGVLESDTMISVRGGKGRWNPRDCGKNTEFVSGGHVFEGWSGNELCRLTMLMGKFHETFACIQTYSPAGLYETNRRFGWVKIGSDDKFNGVDFSKKWTTCYTPITLAPQNAPTTVPDSDLNPQLGSSVVPIGTMYFDENAQRVKVYTKIGWQALAFAGESSGNGGNGGESGEVIEPIVSYKAGLIAVENGEPFLGSNGRLACFPLNKYTNYTVTRSALSKRFRVYLFYNSSIDNAVANKEYGYLVAQDENNTSLESLSFNSVDYVMAVVMLSNTSGDTSTTITVEMEE